MLKLAYNPIKFFPYFRIEKNEFSINGDNIKLFDKFKDKDGEEKIRELDIEINKFTPEKKHYIFFYFFELLLLVIGIFYIIYTLFIIKTDIFTLFVYFCGVGISLFFIKNHNFVLSEIVISLTSLICMIGLYITFKRLEIVFSHVGIFFVSYFIISYVFFNLHIKREIVRSNPIWGKISSYKFFLIFDNGK